MARFNFPAFQAFSPVPREMKEMWNAFGQTLGLLRSAFENGIVVADNVNHYAYQGPVEYGVAIRIAHTLKRQPAHIFCTSGRVEFIKQLLVSATEATILCRLFTTVGTAEVTVGLTDRLNTLDWTFFNPLDTVTVDGVPNVVTRVLPGYLIFQNPIKVRETHTISLAVENVKLLFV